MRPFRQAAWPEPLIFELSRPGRRGISLPHGSSAPSGDGLVPPGLERKTPLGLPEVTEPQVVRHFTRLSQMSYGIDSGFYPLGSCTMKYNPKLADAVAALPGFQHLHPEQDEGEVQGVLKALYRLRKALEGIGGVHEVCLQPAAGAHGEFAGLAVARAYLDHRDGGHRRTEVIVPDTAHGTNPASAAMVGYDVVEIPSGPEGTVDLTALENALSERTAAFMLTNPNTLGIFEPAVAEIARMVHDAGAVLYYDGANLNAIMGYTRPGDMGFDVVHFNLHKTFATPHGGGGPGAGPIGVSADLAPFLPVPQVVRRGDSYAWDWDRPLSIGKVRAWYGNIGVCLRALAYIELMGADGLKRASQLAVLNANWLRRRLRAFPMPFGELRKHEFVLSGAVLKEGGVRTLDLAKGLLDKGIHAPTVYFPHLVPEAIMVEPTETESREDLDAFAEAMEGILAQSRDDPASLSGAPSNTAAGRLDETLAARSPVLSWMMRPR